MRIKRFSTILLLIALSIFCFSTIAAGTDDDKINGISLVGRPQPIDASAFTPIKEVNASWISVIPFAFGTQGKTSLYFDTSFQWWGEKTEGICKTIEIAHAQQVKVMLKPQVWFRGGTYVGHYDLETENQWQEWENNYGDYIIHYAHIADSMKVDMYCIGTEFTNFYEKRPQFWGQLIAEVRTIYSGPLTFAANWDAYEKFPHWDKLDHVGIDAYFPLSEKKQPEVEHLVKGWKEHYNAIKEFQACNGASIIFTEFGYRSAAKATAQPWDSSNNTPEISHSVQSNALKAIFQQFWDEEWFAGGFTWNWYPKHEKAGGMNDGDFTPQNKPAEEVLRQWYGRYR